MRTDRGLRLPASVLAAGSCGLAVVLLWGAGWRVAVPLTAVLTIVALVLLGRRSGTDRTVAAAFAVAVASGFGTVLVEPPRTDPAVALPTVAEAGALLVLVFVVARTAPLRSAVAPVLALAAAQSVLVLRLTSPRNTREFVTGVAVWSLASATATAAGGFFRLLDLRHRDAVAEARHRQRMDLARDVHDYVAHDVSAIVVQAQSALLVADAAPEQAWQALRNIERAGLQALASMDRAIDMLRTGTSDRTDSQLDGPEARRTYGLEDLPDLVERFSAAGSTAVELRVEPELTDLVSREAAATAYRVVVESLTNVRRHARGARSVTVDVTEVDDGGQPAMSIRVADDGGDQHPGWLPPGADRSGGLGLIGLTERVEALGGTLRAGRLPDGDGWRVTARLPLSRIEVGGGP